MPIITDGSINPVPSVISVTRLAASVALIWLAATGEAAPVPVHVGGRVVAENDGSLSFGWPGTYFEGRFEGGAIRIRFDTPTDHMRLLVDGHQRVVFEKPGQVDLTVAGLGPGSHVVRLEKLTESQVGGGRFVGFATVGDGKALQPQPRARRIEFIGDSHTVGYGNRSSRRECTRQEVHDLTDTQQAFGPLLAKRLEADYRVNAYSGFGVVRNYNGANPQLSLPAIYPRLKPDTPSSAKLANDGWQPQLIVINLGTNDFSTPLKSGERWKEDADLRADFRRRYSQFLDQLHALYPQAKFILMASDEFFEDVRQVASLARLIHLQVREIQLGQTDLMGCDWHPSLADNRKFADLLEKEVAAIDPW